MGLQNRTMLSLTRSQKSVEHITLLKEFMERNAFNLLKARKSWRVPTNALPCRQNTLVIGLGELSEEQAKPS